MEQVGVERTRRTAGQLAVAERGRQVQSGSWQVRRAARLAELGFGDLAGYLQVRHVEQGWSIKRMRVELGVVRNWLVDQNGMPGPATDNRDACRDLVSQTSGSMSCCCLPCSATSSTGRRRCPRPSGPGAATGRPPARLPPARRRAAASRCEETQRDSSLWGVGGPPERPPGGRCSHPSITCRKFARIPGCQRDARVASRRLGRPSGRHAGAGGLWRSIALWLRRWLGWYERW